MLGQFSNRCFGFAWVIFGICFTVHPVHAQTMYRCGNTYQDSPCQNAPASKTVNTSGSAKAASSSTAPINDVQCSGRGAEALKITWQREAGKTLEQQLTGINSPTQRALIEETYSIRGTAPEVRSAIEAACVKRKEEALKAAALIEAARATDGAARPTTSAPTAAQSSQPPAPPFASVQPKDRTETARSQAQCDSLESQLSNIRSQQRQGGSISVQEELNARRRDLERRVSSAKC